MKAGMDRGSGKPLTGPAYLRQRLADVIKTPLGSLVGRRGFGSDFWKLIDRNVDDNFYMSAYVTLADAINNPANGLDDFELSEMRVEKVGESHYEIGISGLLENGEPCELEGIRYG